MRFFRWVTALGCICICLLTAWVCRLQNPYGDTSGGVLTEREYYLYSPSSQAAVRTETAFGESVYIQGEKSTFLFQTLEDAGRYAVNLLKAQRAQVYFEEDIAGARSIYAYSQRLGGGVRVGGVLVNLHIVISGEFVQVGTPMIFGAY